MSKYLVLYRSSTPPGEMMASMTQEQAEAGMKLWTEWAAKAGGSLVDLGSPLAPQGSVGASVRGEMPVCGFSVVEATSKDDVERLLEGHPHFETPGENSIEILEFLAVPGM